MSPLTMCVIAGLLLLLAYLAKSQPFIRGTVLLGHRTRLRYTARASRYHKRTQSRTVTYVGNILDDDEGIIYQIKATIVIKPDDVQSTDITGLCLINIAKVFLDEIKKRVGSPARNLLTGPDLFDGLVVEFHSTAYAVSGVAVLDCR